MVASPNPEPQPSAVPLSPEREAERLLSALYDALDAFQRTARLPGLQHAQMRGHLAEHLRDALLAEGSPAAALLAEAARLTAERDGLLQRLNDLTAERDELKASLAAEPRATDGAVDVLRKAIEAARGEYLTDDTGDPEDAAYNRGVSDAVAAIGALSEAGGR